MVRRLSQVFLVFLMLLIVSQAEGQSSRVPVGSAKYKYFQIPGRVKMDKGVPSGTIVRLIDLDSKQIEKSIAISSSGKFDLELNFFKEYILSISKEGYYDKEISISTVIPRDVWEKDSIFPPFFIVVTLYKKVPGAKLSFEGKTIGKLSYSPNGTLDNFDSNVLIDDQAIQDEIDTALKNIDENDFNQKMAEALDAEKKNDLTTAYSLYSVASKIKPSDKFVKEKLKEIASDLKILGSDAKTQAEYDRFIAMGDANVNGFKYNEAIQYYKGALKVRPNDPVAISKIADSEKQLALAGDKAKKDAEFNRLIAAGDADVNQSKYAEAISSFKQALEIRPGDLISLARITDAEKQLALAGDKAKKDAEFNRLIAAGDANVSQSKFVDAIGNFKSALEIKPNDSIATARLAEAEKQLAMAGDKARKDDEFIRLIGLGDVNVGQSKYADAITLYKSALKLKSNEVVIAKIAEAERLLQLAEAERIRQESERQLFAMKQQEYKEAIDKADQFFNIKNFPGARRLYLLALTMDHVPVYPGERIQEIDKIMAQIQTDALAHEQENAKTILYKDAMNRGGTYFTAKLYSNAISAYSEAQKIKPAEIMPSQKIKEIQLILDALAAQALEGQKNDSVQYLNNNEKLYSEKIKIADENFTKSQWSVARFYYIEALKFKQSDNYSLGKVDACDRMVDSGITAEKMQEYKHILSKADAEMTAKNFSSARFFYRSASDILNWEIYPKQQLKEIDKIVTEKLNESDQKLFTANLNKADEAFNHQEYPVARFYYNKATEIGQSNHVTSRLKEIESIVNGSESKKIDTAYIGFIKKGDEAVKQKNNSIARFYYQKAIDLKPGENYPKEEIKKIESGEVNP